MTSICLLLLLLLPPPAAAMTHGWDCISCKTNSMLVSNFGTWRKDITLGDPWWINATADSHAAIILNNFWKQGPGSYNGTGEDSKVTIARLLKARNPKLKVLFYQPADRLGDTAYVTDALDAHPEWWLRDDNSNLIPFGDRATSTRPQIDTSVVAAQNFFANLSVSLFHEHADAARLLDGVMVDGTSWSGPGRYGPNVSAARYERLFAGKMAMLAKMQAILKALSGGEVWGNPLLEYGQIGGPGKEGDQTGARWNTTMAYYDGAFDEMFGVRFCSFLLSSTISQRRLLASWPTKLGLTGEPTRRATLQAFGTMADYGKLPGSGAWDVVKMRYSFEAILNASNAGKTIVRAGDSTQGLMGGRAAPLAWRLLGIPTHLVLGRNTNSRAPSSKFRTATPLANKELSPQVIHAFPGPAGANDKAQGGMFPTRGDAVGGNTFHVAAWAGPVEVPQTADGCRAAAAARLVESLAPFLIVASERVFFGYGWFYNLEDGYIPCPPHIECGMPSEWFPEYSRPLGAPLGPPTTDATKTVWQRRFAHASVSVDLRNRSLSKIVWG
jgi:hypothetical protein